ncbi:MAG: MATE family efflux transporter [Eubacteriales bacterium]|nr:MATE family efflux transporter [Eubacteriales bacterium]
MEQKKERLFDNRTLAALILPLIVEQLLAVLVGMADSIMVASVGEAAVSGVSLVDNIMILFINLFSALATGGAVIAGQYLGQGDRRKSGQAATQLIWFAAAFSIAIMAGIYLGRDLILHRVFGSIEADVMEHARIYLMIVTASIPFMAIYNGGAAIFRAMGNSGVSMRVSVIMNAINCGGNAILIYGFHRGTEGVAIPTLVSRMTAAVLIVALLLKSGGPIRIERTLRFRFDGAMVRRILGIGLPNGMENGMFQLGKIMVLSLVSTFGTSAITANAVSNAVALFQLLPGMAINLAITSVIARCVGAGEYGQAEYYTKKLTCLTYVCMLAINALIYLVLPLILRAYQLTPQTAATARQILYFHSVGCILLWPLSFCIPCTLRAAGDARVTMWISVFSMWFCRIVMSYVLGKYMGMGVFGVWVAMILDWCVRAVGMLYRYRLGKWRQIRSIG